MSRSTRRSRRDDVELGAAGKTAKSRVTLALAASVLGVLVVWAVVLHYIHRAFPFLVWDVLVHVADINWRRPGEDFVPVRGDAKLCALEELLYDANWESYKAGLLRLPPDTDVNALTEKFPEETVPRLAALTGNLELFGFCYRRGMDRSYVEPGTGETLLMAAVASLDEQVLRWMLDQGNFAFDVNGRDKEGYTALIRLAGAEPKNAARDITQFQERMGLMMLRRGAEVDAVTNEGYTALVMACALKRVPTRFIEHLLRHGADANLMIPQPDRTDRAGPALDVFDWAVTRNRTGLLRLFLAAGFSPVRKHHPKKEHRIFLAIRGKCRKSIADLIPTLGPELRADPQVAAVLAEQ